MFKINCLNGQHRTPNINTSIAYVTTQLGVDLIYADTLNSHLSKTEIHFSYILFFQLKTKKNEKLNLLKTFI